jgi:methionyl-tRNA formyltransferase
LKLIFFGTPEFAVPSLEFLLKQPEFEVLAVVTQPDKKRGRGNQMIPSAVKKTALEYHIPVWQPKRVKKHASTLTKLQEAAADAFVVVAYGQLLSPEILAMPRFGCINVHGSILPQYRGAAPIQWSLYNGDAEAGVTTMLMDAGLDTGAMLLKESIAVGLLDNAYHISEQLSSIGADLLAKTLLNLEKGTITPISQDNSQASYASLIQKSDYSIDWHRSAIAIHNQVRGFFPNCITTFREQSLKIVATVPLGEEYWEKLPEKLQKIPQYWPNLASAKGNPGEVVGIIKNFGSVVQTGEGLLLLLEVQLAGKRLQSGWDFVNGTRLSVGEKLM